MKIIGMNTIQIQTMMIINHAFMYLPIFILNIAYEKNR
jgi:hypothetical protein